MCSTDRWVKARESCVHVLLNLMTPKTYTMLCCAMLCYAMQYMYSIGL